MTQADARKKWCPWASNVNSPPDQNSLFGPGTYTCCASDCMSWRWFRTEQDSGYCGNAGLPGAESP
jgi:hypothetical protein